MTPILTAGPIARASNGVIGRGGDLPWRLKTDLANFRAVTMGKPVIMAYASDMNMLSTAMRPHRVEWQTPGLQSASLDHAMWFHKPSNFNEWHLYHQDSPSASGGRGFVRGSIYDAKGDLVASVTQEGLIRLRKPEAKA